MVCANLTCFSSVETVVWRPIYYQGTKEKIEVLRGGQEASQQEGERASRGRQGNKEGGGFGASRIFGVMKCLEGVT